MITLHHRYPIEKFYTYIYIKETCYLPTTAIGRPLPMVPTVPMVSIGTIGYYIVKHCEFVEGLIHTQLQRRQSNVR